MPIQPVIIWIKANRLKAVSAFAVCGDILMGMAGGAGLLYPDQAPPVSYTLLLIASILAFSGHMALFIWGKGARAASVTEKEAGEDLPIWLKPFYPWHYPLDFAFCLWVINGALYIISGALMHMPTIIVIGLCNLSASALGWFYPQDKKIGPYYAVQVTAMCFFMSSLSTYVSAYLMMDIFILLAACSYSLCNFILYTVRKENQSLYTQTHS